MLLCTMHGQRYLHEQLDSIAAQTHANWTVWASDDGSGDNTRAILERYRSEWGGERLWIEAGPARGFAANFLHLTCNPGIRADYYAYADQDDIWERDKLARALVWLESVPREVPALYCCRTCLVDDRNRELGLSPRFDRPPSFANALVQSIAGGNTIVFNRAARDLLCAAGPDVEVVTHDWWVYLVVSGCGGKVFYDPIPAVRYRQHDGNLVGANVSWPARLLRLRMLFRGHFRTWNEQNLRALQRIRNRLTLENRRKFDYFAAARNRWLVPRVASVLRAGVYRQTLLGNIGLAAATLLKKL